MAERITGIVGYGKSLALLTATSIVVTHNNGKEPKHWPQEVFAFIGTNDEFVRQLAIEFMELLGATNFPEPRRAEIKSTIMVLLIEGLLPAYERLREIRALSGKQIPVLNRRQQFEDFTSALWRAYKTLLPKTAVLLGFNIGFLFQEAKEFEAGARKFESVHPGQAFMIDYLRAQRTNWQQELKEFRNKFVEHRNTDRGQFTKYYEQGTAESLFDAVWKTIANLLPVFIAANFNGPIGIEEIPPNQRSAQNPRRFRWVLRP